MYKALPKASKHVSEVVTLQVKRNSCD